jgi:hypothetical protein
VTFANVFVNAVVFADACSSGVPVDVRNECRAVCREGNQVRGGMGAFTGSTLTLKHATDPIVVVAVGDGILQHVGIPAADKVAVKPIAGGISVGENLESEV